MSTWTLVIGNKNYSSWSLRAWLMLRHLELEFSELRLPLDTAEFRARITALSPNARVPALITEELTVWDSLAICEYAADTAGRGWPTTRGARAVARAVSAEMHSGFAALRATWPMNARAVGRRVVPGAAAAADLSRIDGLWLDCRRRFGANGPWLFGEYSVADAMYAPVACRIRTYGMSGLSGESARYLATALADPWLADWTAAASAEPEVVPKDEIGTA
jgi:glutathione S-transferase